MSESPPHCGRPGSSSPATILASFHTLICFSKDVIESKRTSAGLAVNFFHGKKSFLGGHQPMARIAWDSDPEGL